MLVPWSAARLDDADAAQIEALGHQVAGLCQRLRRSIDLYAWRPTQLRLDQLRHCATNFEISDVCREAVDSSENEIYELFEPQPPRQPAIPYDQAQREFLESVRQVPADLQCREEAWRQLEESQDSDEANGFTVGWPQQPWLAAYRDLDFRGAQFDIVRWALPTLGY